MDSNIASWRRYTFIEPPLILYLFSWALTAAVVTDIMVFRSCQSIEGIGKNTCDVLHINSSSPEALDLEVAAQPWASYILMCKSLLDGIVPALLSFFLGPWSDEYGRKPLMIAGYGGSALSFLVWTILSTLNIDPRFFLLSSIPSALMGGYCGLLLASFCYITDIRKESDRAWHLTCLQVLMSAGIFFGTLSGSVIFNRFGYATVFGVACGCSSLATIYVIFFVPETVARADSRTFWCTLFDVSLVKGMLVTCTKKRDGFNRVIAWCCITCLSLKIFAMDGELNIEFMFSSAKFGWNVSEYSFYQGISVFIGIVGTLLGAKLFKMFIDQDLSDMGIALFSTTSLFIGAMTKALAMKPWHMFLSTSLSMLGGLSAPVLRTALSKSGPPQDAGKIFSLTTSMEAVVPLAASLLYTMVYTHNMPPIFPAPVFLVSAGIFSVIIILVIVIDKQTRESPSRYVAINADID